MQSVEVSPSLWITTWKSAAPTFGEQNACVADYARVYIRGEEGFRLAQVESETTLHNICTALWLGSQVENWFLKIESRSFSLRKYSTTLLRNITYLLRRGKYNKWPNKRMFPGITYHSQCILSQVGCMAVPAWHKHVERGKGSLLTSGVIYDRTFLIPHQKIRTMGSVKSWQPKKGEKC